MMYPDNKKHSRCAGLPEVQTCSPMNDRCCHRRNRLNGQTGSALKGAGGIGGLLARSDNTQMIIGSSSEHDYYHADGNGNVTMLINSSQAVVAKYLYDPFGNTLSLSGSLAAANVYRFSSKAWNDNAGLYYYGPVSYTHLDVYKRQEHGCSGTIIFPGVRRQPGFYARLQFH